MTDLYPKNRTVTAFELWAQHVRGYQPFLGVRSFGMIQIRINDLRSPRSWRIKATEKSLPRVDSSVPLMRHDLSNLVSLILIWIIPKERTLKFGKPFHADKVYGIKIFTTLQWFVQVNVLSSLEVDCLTWCTHLVHVVEGVTLHENKFMQIWDTSSVNWRHVLSIVHWPMKTPPRALYCALPNENSATCFLLCILLHRKKKKTEIQHDL